MTSEAGSFARKTIVERKPQIINRVIADNDYPPSTLEKLMRYTEEIATQPITALSDVREDTNFWNTHWAKYRGKTWLELPWYFAETYFYRRLLEAVDYLEQGDFYNHDPFFAQKVTQEDTALAQLAESWSEISEIEGVEGFILHLHNALWGNRADLSNFTVRETAAQGTSSHILKANILIDHTYDVLDLLSAGVQEVAFISDNVGADSLYDLVLADYLLQKGWTQQVVFHLKNRPFFVSDAMPEDILRVVSKLAESAGQLTGLGNRLSLSIQDGLLRLVTDPFWVSCLTFAHLPAHIHANLNRADLIILKGDVNYRRLLDDRHWPATTPVEEIASRFPKPALILRTMKGEIVAGLAEGQAERCALEDPDWLINGKRGIIQLIK
jgi:uncharacterized protein with ATP-grasp and redox domains